MTEDRWGTLISGMITLILLITVQIVYWDYFRPIPAQLVLNQSISTIPTPTVTPTVSPKPRFNLKELYENADKLCAKMNHTDNDSNGPHHDIVQRVDIDKDTGTGIVHCMRQADHNTNSDSYTIGASEIRP